MAENKKKPNIFKRIAIKFNDVRLELKRVIWPTKEKLVQTSAVVLVVIAVCAILLTTISKGASWILEKIGFYGQVAETTISSITPGEESETSADPSESSSEETSASTEASTEATSEESTPSES